MCLHKCHAAGSNHVHLRFWAHCAIAPRCPESEDDLDRKHHEVTGRFLKQAQSSSVQGSRTLRTHHRRRLAAIDAVPVCQMIHPPRVPAQRRKSCAQIVNPMKSCTMCGRCCNDTPGAGSVCYACNTSSTPPSVARPSGYQKARQRGASCHIVKR